MNSEPNWEWEIATDRKWYHLGLRELVQYKDLIVSFYKRELLAAYQQTIIGVSWIVLQPLLTTLFYFIVFNKIVKVSTDNTPPVLFYMSGSILWAYFSDCLAGAMYSFLHNAHIYNKVYFPRMVVPLSMVLNHSVRFGIQFVLFLLAYGLFAVLSGHLWLNWDVLWVPVLFLQLVAFALGIGLVVSVYVARYRDVEHIMSFILRLFMFVTPVFYPASIVPAAYKTLFWLNPLTPVIEAFRTIFFHTGTLHPVYLIASAVSSALVLIAGLIIFRKKELKVIDTI
jgi:homopolymeric O-antigen transport system permease protein